MNPKQKLSEAEKVAKIAAFGFDHPIYAVCDRLLDVERNLFCEYDGYPISDETGRWRCPSCHANRGLLKLQEVSS